MSDPTASSPASSLDRPVQFVKGVGPVRAEALGRLGITTARDLLYHIPRRYHDASTLTPVSRVHVGDEVTVAGTVRSKGVVPTRAGLRIFQAVIQDDTGAITCSWPGQPWMDRILRMGDHLLVTGPVKSFHGRQIQPREHALLSRPGKDKTGEPAGSPGTVFVTYRATESLPQWFFRGVIRKNLDRMLQQVGGEDILSSRDRGALGLIPLARALEILHRPQSEDQVAPAKRRLAFDELYFHQVLQAQAHYRATREKPGISFVRTNRLIRALHRRLPFTLTGAQVRVLRKIYDDMTSDQRMNRMLQGDVGSGKTLVALFAMLLAVEGGHQAALMVPTGILAEQHAERIRSLLSGLKCPVDLLVGSLSGNRRDAVRARVASARTGIVVGTHALIQEGVEFGNLGLVVVDEQHRFGVRQRTVLAQRDPRPDVLVMSATPIPRTLAMARHGSLDMSVIDELPQGRRPVTTTLASEADRVDVFREVRRRVAQGQQAYVVYPIIEESESADLLAAEAEYERLRREDLAGCALSLLHGRVGSDERDRIMRSFLAGDTDVLVATTVIEVGIDVPNATMMVIENAERFGLSQLHQLRGRIGRGELGGHCVVISGSRGEASERLGVFATTTDGFKIAQADLDLRGEGSFFGREQHGHQGEYRFADLVEHADLLERARLRAKEVVGRDPGLKRRDNRLLRRLLEKRYGEEALLFELG